MHSFNLQLIPLRNAFCFLRECPPPYFKFNQRTNGVAEVLLIYGPHTLVFAKILTLLPLVNRIRNVLQIA